MICLFLGWSLHEVGLNMSVGRNCCTGDDRDGRGGVPRERWAGLETDNTRGCYRLYTGE